MTNYGALAILALRTRLLISDLRLLIALETVSADGDGTRKIGMTLLARKAGLPYETARKSARRLAGQKLIAWTPGSGKGHYTQWKILLDLTPPKVSIQGEHLSGAKGVHPTPLKVSNQLPKGVQANAVTSGNANTGLKAFGLHTSGLSRREPRTQDQNQGQGQNHDPAAVADLLADLRRRKGWLPGRDQRDSYQGDYQATGTGAF